MNLTRRMKIVDTGTEVGDAMASSIKVAFATTDMNQVNQHFGSAESFALYAVDPDNALLLEVAQFGKLAQDGNEDKLAAKIAMLDGCTAVYCQAVGASAVKQLVAKGIHPVKVSEGAEIQELVAALQAEMRNGPSAWLAKAIGRQDGPSAKRFDAMEAEGWDE